MRNVTQKALTILPFITLIGIFIIGCELGVNPLLFDGSPVSVKFRIDETGTAYAKIDTLHLNGIRASFDKHIDSIKVFNITLLIDSTAGTDTSTTISGTAVIDGHILLTLTHVRLSTFSSERSIFDTTMASAGFSFNSDGVSYLLDLMSDLENLPSYVVVNISGTAPPGPLHFCIRLKLYTQLYTTP
ncbi:MAG: hypothetical protein HYR76_00650 [Ignavibacteria bacterium]|nr:hypothetical protein [Ignavibacteria bacterium]MBI3765075.1 hypothetical protein [Ignavibacteriales bacterium]